MNNFSAEQFATATKNAAAEFSDIVTSSFSSFEKLAELNLATAKHSLNESLSSFQALVGAKTPAELLAVQTALVQPMAEKAAAYGRSVYEISVEAGTELSKAAEGKLAQGQKTFSEAVEALAKNAPAGSETLVSAFKSAMATGQQVIESAQAAAKQAVAQAQSNVASATDVAVKAAKTAAKKA